MTDPIAPYDWDEAKRAANIADHKIDFTAVYDFDWDTAVFDIDDREDYGELREIAVGFIGVTIARRYLHRAWRMDKDHQLAQSRQEGCEAICRRTDDDKWAEAKRKALRRLETMTDEEDAEIHAGRPARS